MEYVYFYTEDKANAFFIACLDRGIYCKKTYNTGLIWIEIDVERTCKEKNEGSSCKNK